MERDSAQTFTTQPFMKPGTEIAIIGFWKRDYLDSDSFEWKCYYYYNVPNPVRREIRRSERGKEKN